MNEARYAINHERGDLITIGHNSYGPVVSLNISSPAIPLSLTLI